MQGRYLLSVLLASSFYVSPVVSMLANDEGPQGDVRTGTRVSVATQVDRDAEIAAASLALTDMQQEKIIKTLTNEDSNEWQKARESLKTVSLRDLDSITSSVMTSKASQSAKDNVCAILWERLSSATADDDRLQIATMLFQLKTPQELYEKTYQAIKLVPIANVSSEILCAIGVRLLSTGKSQEHENQGVQFLTRVSLREDSPRRERWFAALELKKFYTDMEKQLSQGHR